MNFIEPTIEVALEHLKKLNSDSSPSWGTMSAQRMVEHLEDTLLLAIGTNKFELQIPEDKIERAQAFIFSDHPLPKNFEVNFAPKEMSLRESEIALSIDSFINTWLIFEDTFKNEPGKTTLHPSFGMLNYEQWVRLNSKHLTHHFEQFGI